MLRQSLVALLLCITLGKAQVPTSRDPTPWGAAVGRRGPSGAEDMVWAQLGHAAGTQHLVNSMEMMRLRAAESADKQLAAGTYKPVLTASPARESVNEQIAILLKQQGEAMAPYPALAAVWMNPPVPAIHQYLDRLYRYYEAEMRTQRKGINDLANACSFLVEAEYRAMDAQHRTATPREQMDFRGTCIVSIGRLEKSGALAQQDERGALAQTLAVVGAGYIERLQYALMNRDSAVEQQLQTFVTADFQQTFHYAPQQLPAPQFACVLLDNLDQCPKGLPVLEHLLDNVVARNP